MDINITDLKEVADKLGIATHDIYKIYATGVKNNSIINLCFFIVELLTIIPVCWISIQLVNAYVEPILTYTTLEYMFVVGTFTMIEMFVYINLNHLNTIVTEYVLNEWCALVELLDII